MSHAILSPSSAYRWMACPPSARAEAVMPEETSVFAEEGTQAHEAAAGILEGAVVQFADDEMREAVESYVAIVREKYERAKEVSTFAIMLVEQRLDLTVYAPEAFGTADAVIIADGTMEVIDFKYGKGVKVEAYHNPQMMMYGLGALQAFGTLYNVEDVRMTIVQPRMGNVCEYEVSADELLQWGNSVLKPAALLAFEGEGSPVAGDHCRFCKMRGRCAALAHTATAQRKGVELMSDEELAEAYSQLDTVKIWAKAVEEECVKVLKQGRALPGYKLVAGVSRRKYADEASLLQELLGMGYQSTEVCKPIQLLGITDMKKVLGTTKFRQIVEPACVRAETSPVIAPMSDKREPIDFTNDFINEL